MLLITIFFFNRCNILEAYIESSWVPIKSDTDHEIQTLSNKLSGMFLITVLALQK